VVEETLEANITAKLPTQNNQAKQMPD